MTPDPAVCPLSRIVATRVRTLRKEAGWSQPFLARKAGISACMVSFLEGEQRNFTLPVLEKIAGALGAEPADLLTPVPVPEEPEGAPQEPSGAPCGVEAR